MAIDDWLELTDGSFKGFVFHVAVPTRGLDSHGATDITVESGRRIHQIKRPFVDGQRTIDLGAEGQNPTADIIFFGPTYLDRFEEFRAILNLRDKKTQSTSGLLILPDRRKALKATFLKMTETSRAGEAESKSIRVTWVQDEVTIQEAAVGAADGLIPESVLDAVKTVNNVVSAAGGVLRNNPILATIRQFETIVSSTTSSIVTVVALGEAVRTRVLTTIANVEGAFATILVAINQIGNFFGGEAQPSGFDSGRVDSLTGQPIEDADADDEVTAIEDPLEAPEAVPDETITLASLETADGLNKFLEDSKSLLEDSSESLELDTEGRTEDVSISLTEVINSIRDIVEAAAPSKERLVVTPLELSLAEVLFENDVDLNLLDNVLKKNSFITDIHIVPRGSVVRLC